MKGNNNKGKRNRRTNRRPRDDRVRKIRINYSASVPMSELLSSGLPRVRDCRLQSIRIVGGNTPTIKVYLSGGFTNGENINLATVQKTPLRLDRTLTVPKRVREYFLDSEPEGNESYVILAQKDDDKSIQSEISYVEFTLLAESPPVLTLGLNSCGSNLVVKFDGAIGASSFTVDKLDITATEIIEFTYSGVQYLAKLDVNGTVNLLAPPKLENSLPTATPLDFKFT